MNFIFLPFLCICLSLGFGVAPSGTCFVSGALSCSSLLPISLASTANDFNLGGLGCTELSNVTSPQITASFTAPSDGTYFFKFQPSPVFDSAIFVANAISPSTICTSGISGVACVDEPEPPTYSRTLFAGQVVAVVVQGYFGGTGNGSLSVTCPSTTASAAPTLAPNSSSIIMPDDALVPIVVGSVIGAVVLCGLVVILVVFIVRRKRAMSQASSSAGKETGVVEFVGDDVSFSGLEKSDTVSTQSSASSSSSSSGKRTELSEGVAEYNVAEYNVQTQREEGLIEIDSFH